MLCANRCPLLIKNSYHYWVTRFLGLHIRVSPGVSTLDLEWCNKYVDQSMKSPVIYNIESINFRYLIACLIYNIMCTACPK